MVGILLIMAQLITGEIDRPAFINRKADLAVLNGILDRRGAQMTVVYGRRRIGKTSLLDHWLKSGSTPGFYWVAHRSTPEMLLRSFSEAITEALGESLVAGLTFTSWEQAFRQLFAMGKNGRFIAVIDELPYLLESVPSAASLLQKVWDKESKASQLCLMLCGSQYQMMHKEMFSPNQPLYGRATAALLLEEIPPESLNEFLPRYSPQQVVETYSIIGGVPKYLEMWNDGSPVLNNIRDLILSPATLFRHEALFLIQDEIAEPRTYLGILEAMGAGLRTPTQISRITGLPLTHVGKYLSTLMALRLVRRVASAEAPDPKATRLSRYEIRDPYLRFHFEFVHPHPELVEQNRQEAHLAKITARFESHVGKTGYEELARAKVQSLADSGQLPFQPSTIGRAWSRDAEVDVFAIDRKSQSVLLGECRWQSRKMGIEVLTELKEKATAFPRLKAFKKHYALFSKAGFTAELQRTAQAEGVLLFEGALL
jgi:hypothetical protein